MAKDSLVMPTVGLRPVEDSDLDAIFEQMRDPASVQMAAFTTEDPNDRAAFDAHMARVMGSPDTTNRAITYDDRLVGTIASFVFEGATELTYWIDRSYWWQGIATRALALLLEEVSVRPYTLVSPATTSDRCGSYKRPGSGALAPRRHTLPQGVQRSKRRSWSSPSYFPELSHNNDLRLGTRCGCAGHAICASCGVDRAFTWMRRVARGVRQGPSSPAGRRRAQLQRPLQWIHLGM